MEKEDIELNKVKNESSNSGILYTLVVAIVALGAYIGYIHFAYNMVDKGYKEEVKIENTTPPSFESLPYEIRERYINVGEHERKLNTLERDMDRKLLSLQQDLKLCNEDKEKAEKVVAKIDEKIAEVTKMQENITEIEDMVNGKKDNSLDRSKFITFRCYNMENGGYYPSKQCLKRLNLFLDKNKDDTKMFEVIGVVNNQDFKLLERLKDVYKEARIDRLEEFAQYGLARKRVIEATWAVKRHLGSSKKVSIVNYMVTSKKGYKGFVVRAYK